MRAAGAWHRGLASDVLACGGRRWAGQSEARVLQTLLLDAGVPASRVHSEHCSLNTFENIWYAVELLEGLGAKRLFVVTCDFHISRALSLFSDAGFDCVGLAATTPPSKRRLRGQLSEFASRALQPVLKQLRPSFAELLPSTVPPRLLESHVSREPIRGRARDRSSRRDRDRKL